MPNNTPELTMDPMVTPVMSAIMIHLRNCLLIGGEVPIKTGNNNKGPFILKSCKAYAKSRVNISPNIKTPNMDTTSQRLLRSIKALSFFLKSPSINQLRESIIRETLVVKTESGRLRASPVKPIKNILECIFLPNI